ncbi:MAG: hypothetical protein DHS20C02_15580 [Micavibrio sp.]|nr:MAG: hypothetical protein DHS20C02_15580 [Micavibrio sp.]
MAKMGFKAFLLALFVGATFVAVTPGNAQAAEDPSLSTGPELYFYPAQAWKVFPSPVAQISNSGNNCTVSNVFNNGFHMELTGTTAGIETLSVNFIQPAFDEGQTYDVSLSVPGSIKREIPGQAPRSELLVVNMQGQQDLYNALRSASVLDLSLMDNVFRFYMTGFADSMKRFDKCTGAGGTTTIPEAAPIKEAAADMPVAEPIKKAAANTDLTAPPPFTPGTSFEDLPVPAKDDGIAVSQRISSRDLSEDVYEMPFEAQEMEASVKGSKNAKRAGITEIIPEDNVPEIKEVDATSEKTSAPVLASSSVSSEVSGSLNKKPSPGGYKRLSERLAEEMGSMAPPKTPSASGPGQLPTPQAATTSSKADDDIEITYIPEPAPKAAPAPTPMPEPAKVAEVQEAPKETIKFNDPPPKKEAAKPIVENHKSPEMKISKTSVKMEKDITELGNVEPSTSGDQPFQSSSRPFADTNMRDKVSEMEKMIRELNQENSKLESELGSALRESEQEHASVSSENWNLERATMRYNEAERQIERLGQQLQRERSACTQDTSKLENMLFDPEVTNEKQMARLVALEREIEAAKAEQDEQRRQYEERIRTLQQQLKTQ